MNFSVGCDIVSISRFSPDKKNINERFLSLNELKKLNLYQSVHLKQKFLASCWAVKESLFKATQLKYDFSHFSLINDAMDFQFKVIFQNFKISYSISEDQDNCIAVCIAEKKD